MGGCAGPLVLFPSDSLETDSTSYSKRPMQDPEDLVVKKRKNLVLGTQECPSLGDMSSDSSSETEEFSDLPKTTDLARLLRAEENLENGSKVPVDFLIDVLWETDEFRLSIQREIDAVFPTEFDTEVTEPGEWAEPRDSAEAENRIFAVAKSANDYLEMALAVIEHFKNKTSRAELTKNASASPETKASSAFDQECISIEKLSKFLQL